MGQGWKIKVMKKTKLFTIVYNILLSSFLLGDFFLFSMVSCKLKQSTNNTLNSL